MTLRRLFWVLLVIFSACPRTESAVDASVLVVAGLDAAAVVDGESLDAGSTQRDAGPADAGMPELPLAFLVETDAGLVTLSFDHDTVELDPVQTFVIESTLGLKDVRVRLIDAADQVVASDDSVSLDGGFSYRLTLQQPTKAGRTYTLFVDAEIGPLLTDLSGRPWDDVRRTLVIRGEPQPEPGRAAKKKPHPKR